MEGNSLNVFLSDEAKRRAKTISKSGQSIVKMVRHIRRSYLVNCISAGKIQPRINANCMDF